jgi:tetratricopeptide (TPR) repeat protein
MTTMNNRINEAIQLTKRAEYLQALTLFLDIYGSEEAPPVENAKAAQGLSYFGLSLALVQKKYKMAVDLCRRALDLEFYNGDHYANLAHVYMISGQRKKAYEIVQTGLRLLPDHEGLQRTRRQLGVRSRPAVPFLDRSNPINVSLGQARQQKKALEIEKRKK